MQNPCWSPNLRSEFQINMAINDTETSTTPSNNVRSVIHCPKSSNFTWDLNETTISWILCPITFIASLATFFLNALVILAVKRKRELKKTSNILLSSMAIADLLVGAISMPLTVAADILIIRQMYYSGFCTLHLTNEYSMFSLLWSSLYHLTLIAWERYVAIRKWIDYKAIITRGRIKNLAIVAWLLAAFTSYPPLVMIALGVDQNTKEAWHIGESIVASVCLITIGYFYIMVYLGVRKRKINEISQVTALVKAKLESKVAKTCGLITAALILSFVPAIVVSSFGEVFPVLGTRKAFILPERLLLLTSLANPLIYFYRDRRLIRAALELLGVRRPEAIQPAVGAARFIRRKDPFGSLEAVKELQKEEQPTRFKRAASCDPAVDSDCVHRRSPEIFLKRSMSAPALDKCIGSADGLQLQQASSIIVTTAIIHSESGARYQAKTCNRELPQDAIKCQDTSHLVRNLYNTPRSNSWDASASMKCSNRCQMLREASSERPATTPLLHSEFNCLAKSRTDSEFATRF